MLRTAMTSILAVMTILAPSFATEIVAEDKALKAIDDFIAASGIDTSKDGWKLNLPKPPKVAFAGKMNYFWNLETNKGSMSFLLDPDTAPMHVSSTMYLTKLGFYDGLSFHRVIPRFMAQGGCPQGNGRGGPGYSYDGEFSNSVRHDRPGLLSMANAGPGTDGSQFFITFVATPHLDGNHTIFGSITAGNRTLKALEASGTQGGAPKEALTINKATITTEPFKDPMVMIKEYIAQKSEEGKIDKSKANWRTRLPIPPKGQFDGSKKYFWELNTNKGPISVELLTKVAPMHVTSTIFLTELGFYDTLTFHRVIPNFMAQGGCPLGSGTGGPGYRYSGEFDPKVRHDRPGLLSMANAGPGTDGSQFFLTFVPTAHLDGKHTIFGEVKEGMETLKALEEAGTAPRGKPKESLVINSAKIVVK